MGWKIGRDIIAPYQAPFQGTVTILRGLSPPADPTDHCCQPSFPMESEASNVPSSKGRPWNEESQSRTCFIFVMQTDHRVLMLSG